jgi:hypothetical protein
MKAYWVSGGIDPHILDLGTRWKQVVSFKPWLLYSQGESPWYQLDRRLGGPQSRSGHGGEEKNSQPLPGLEPPIIQPIAQCCTTELSWLVVLVFRGIKLMTTANIIFILSYFLSFIIFQYK